ncbi:uncharacterized protein MONBRDRAFT_34574 [Monosiga brevicollis MX1]|uniref:Alanine racemase N-terminal domain-containing protein n=1 Tax=Monosiga brevicollis TaxID=81824 RepID=A9VCM1_MONBE|nr:uncharacterized protein MONBRDRAFT_34574 [Monosiga brevicollis MX1]EDQ84709.1 predicted protein [Monosiga brevicollis MX1]|eukprot:XP_001750495.1 hypothetical protein [Monosiga brevicollis MX1]
MLAEEAESCARLAVTLDVGTIDTIRLTMRLLVPVDNGGCPEDIEWHFIGHLQRNKVKQLAAVQGLAMVETVSSQKLADALNKTFAEQERTVSVLIQVNTSREENKHGVLEDEVVAVAKHITASCPALRLCGLMTIGNLEQSLAPEETNPDFETLVRCRAAVASELGRDAEELELSMGMSSDYETAIRQGSTNVRVGSTIFGARHYAPK